MNQKENPEDQDAKPPEEQEKKEAAESGQQDQEKAPPPQMREPDENDSIKRHMLGVLEHDLHRLVRPWNHKKLMMIQMTRNLNYLRNSENTKEVRFRQAVQQEQAKRNKVGMYLPKGASLPRNIR